MVIIILIISSLSCATLRENQAKYREEMTARDQKLFGSPRINRQPYSALNDPMLGLLLGLYILSPHQETYAYSPYSLSPYFPFFPYGYGYSSFALDDELRHALLKYEYELKSINNMEMFKMDMEKQRITDELRRAREREASQLRMEVEDITDELKSAQRELDFSSLSKWRSEKLDASWLFKEAPPKKQEDIDFTPGLPRLDLKPGSQPKKPGYIPTPPPGFVLDTETANVTEHDFSLLDNWKLKRLESHGEVGASAVGTARFDKVPPKKKSKKD
jgi:hypothetical protein